MSRPSLLFAAAALLPAMTAPAEGTPLAAAGALIVALCNGGSMSVPAGGGSQPGSACCCAKGCRTETRRKRIDREQ